MPFGDTPAYDRGIDRGFMMPVGELITSALSNKGNPTGILQDNTFRVKPDQDVRIIDKIGQVLFSGVGPDAARQAVAIGQNLSDTLGNKAGWTIQTGERAITDTGEPQTYFYDVANEKVNKNILGKIADIALPVVGGILGGPLGAAAGSAASGVAQGRGIEDILLRAAIAGGTTALMPGGPPAPGSDAAVSAAANTALQNAVSAGAQAGSQALGSIYGSALGNVAAGGAGSLLGAAASQFPEEIIVTAARNAAPSSLFPAVTGGISNTLLDRAISQPTEVQQPAQQEPVYEQAPIEVTAPAGAEMPVIPPLIPDVAPLEQFKPVEDILKGVDMGPEKQGLLKSLMAKMGPTDYLTAASLLGSAVAGGGGGAGTTAMPYVSPFGAGVGFGAGQDMRVNPNIADYERYAFGPEATFFAPGYSELVSGAAGAPMQTTMGPQSAMLNPNTPTYTPLI